jgi:ribosomal protein S18 acetylase RimI-like enzyme
VTTLDTLETYYDTAPRASATVEELGPFTLFLRADEDGWPFYARPRLGLPAGTTITADDVRRVRERQRELGAPETFEWVHETTPSLLAAATKAGLTVHQCPLMVLAPGSSPAAASSSGSARVLEADSPELGEVVAAVGAGFAGRDEVEPRDAAGQAALIRAGLVRMVGGYDGQGAVVGGGSHSPRGTTTELAGIAVIPRARRQGIGAAITAALVMDARDRGIDTVFLSAQDDTVARVYERIGFQRVGTACIAEPPEA